MILHYIIKAELQGASGLVMLFHLPSLLANLSSEHQVRISFSGCSLGVFQKQGVVNGDGSVKCLLFAKELTVICIIHCREVEETIFYLKTLIPTQF